MIIKDLIAALQKLPPDMDIYLEGPQEDFPHLTITPISESCEDDTVVGYVIEGTDAHQLSLPFKDDDTSDFCILKVEPKKNEGFLVDHDNPDNMYPSVEDKK